MSIFTIEIPASISCFVALTRLIGHRIRVRSGEKNLGCPKHFQTAGMRARAPPRGARSAPKKFPISRVKTYNELVNFGSFFYFYFSVEHLLTM